MAAVTTVPGFGAPVGPAIPRYAPRGATPRGRRVTPTTYRRRRLAAATLALGLVVVAAQAGAALGGSPLASPERRSTASVSATPRAAGATAKGHVVIVQAGDSLWSLAARIAPGEDLRPIVDALSDARDGAPLIPGEAIRLDG